MTEVFQRPGALARAAGVAYLLIIVLALFNEMWVRGTVIVRGDAAATAAKIVANETFYRAGGAGVLINLACDVIVAVLLYELLKPLGRTTSLLAASFRLVMAAMLGINLLHHFAPLSLLGGAAHLKAFETAQLQAMAYASLRTYTQGFNLALGFFGIHCIFLGLLLRKAQFLPRIFGPLMVIAGAGYLLNTLATLVAPTLAGPLYPWILLPAVPAEFGLTGWLLIFGVNERRWYAQAGAAGLIPAATTNQQPQ
jgi:hypothetical protein